MPLLTRGDQDGADHGAGYRARAAEQAHPADHRRGDGEEELVAQSGGREPDHQARGGDEAGDPPHTPLTP